jgi:hypothetical protein
MVTTAVQRERLKRKRRKAIHLKVSNNVNTILTIMNRNYINANMMRAVCGLTCGGDSEFERLELTPMGLSAALLTILPFIVQFVQYKAF